MKVDKVLTPGGSTKYIQAPAISWNKPGRSHEAEQYDNWMID